MIKNRTTMKRKPKYHKNLTTINGEIFNTRYGQITVTVVFDKTATLVHNYLEFQIPHTMSSDALLKWKVTNRQLLDQLRKDERLNWNIMKTQVQLKQDLLNFYNEGYYGEQVNDYVAGCSIVPVPKSLLVGISKFCLQICFLNMNMDRFISLITKKE